MSIEMTMHELWEKAHGPAREVQGGISREINLLVREKPFRFVPKSMVDLAKEEFQKNQNGDTIATVLSYLLNGFYVYRQTVSGIGGPGWVAAHVFVDGAYEWPSPSNFSWNKLDTVISAATYMHGPIIQDDSTVVVSTVRGSSIDEDHIDLESGDQLPRIRRRDINLGKDFLSGSLKYSIFGGLESVGFLNHSRWQNRSLSTVFNPLKDIYVDFVTGRLSLEDAQIYLMGELEGLSESYPAVVGRYLRQGETSNGMAIMMS
jgi:hypothetical protein